MDESQSTLARVQHVRNVEKLASSHLTHIPGLEIVIAATERRA